MTNQEKLRKLCADGKATQEEAARLIAAQTMRPCAVRTVRAWLADAEKSSSRPCPDWAVIALEKKLRSLKRLLTY